MCKKLIVLCVALALAAISVPVYGVIITNTNQNVEWMDEPTITVIDPPSAATVGESFVNGVVSQTFTVLAGPTTLDTIAISVAGGGGGGGAYTLRLVDLGVVAAPQKNLATYAAGTDLWGGTVTWTYGGSARTVFEFDFRGAEELVLTVGNTYAFELTGGETASMYWYRGGDVYAGGAMYNAMADGTRQYIPRMAPRSSATAVYLTPEPATIALLGLGGLALLRRKRAN